MSVSFAYCTGMDPSKCMEREVTLVTCDTCEDKKLLSPDVTTNVKRCLEQITLYDYVMRRLPMAVMCTLVHDTPLYHNFCLTFVIRTWPGSRKIFCCRGPSSTSVKLLLNLRRSLLSSPLQDDDSLKCIKHIWFKTSIHKKQQYIIDIWKTIQG